MIAEFVWTTGATAIIVALIGAAGGVLATVLAAQARARAEDARKTEAEHFQIVHSLVNSTLSRSMQSDLDTSIHAAAVMRENIALNREKGVEPSDDTNAALVLLDAKILTLGKDILERNTEAMDFATRPR